MCGQDVEGAGGHFCGAFPVTCIKLVATMPEVYFVAFSPTMLCFLYRCFGMFLNAGTRCGVPGTICCYVITTKHCTLCFGDLGWICGLGIAIIASCAAPTGQRFVFAILQSSIPFFVWGDTAKQYLGRYCQAVSWAILPSSILGDTANQYPL